MHCIAIQLNWWVFSLTFFTDWGHTTQVPNQGNLHSLVVVVVVLWVRCFTGGCLHICERVSVIEDMFRNETGLVIRPVRVLFWLLVEHRKWHVLWHAKNVLFVSTHTITCRTTYEGLNCWEVHYDAVAVPGSSKSMFLPKCYWLWSVLGFGGHQLWTFDFHSCSAMVFPVYVASYYKKLLISHPPLL